jgi:hypothetical protein
MSTATNYRFREGDPIQFTEAQLDTLKAILDTFIAPLPQKKEDELVEKLKNTHTEQEVRQFCRLRSTSFQLLDSVLDFINRTVLPEKRPELVFTLNLLTSRAGTFCLTGHFDEFKNLTLAEREKVFLSWKQSYLPQLRLMYKTFAALALHPGYAAHSDILGEAMHYNTTKTDRVYDNLPPRYTFMDPAQITDLLHFDVIIIGSGAGGGKYILLLFYIRLPWLN